MTWWFSIWMTFWERLVVGRWLQVWYTGHHFGNCWLMLNRPPLEPKHFIVWWVFSFFEFIIETGSSGFCCFGVGFWYDEEGWPHYWTALLETFFQWFYRMHRRTSIPRTFSAGDLILTPQALLKWKIYWMVCCVSTGWLKKFYMLFSSFQVAKFATSFGRWLDPSRWLINPRDFRNQDFARKLRDTAEELCQDIIDLTPVLVACQVKCAPKKPLTNMALKRQGLNFVWCKDRHIEMWAQRGSVSWNDSKAVLRFLCMLSWSQCIDLCSKGTDGWWLNWCQLWALAVQILPLLIFQFFFNAGSLIACSSIHA